MLVIKYQFHSILKQSNHFEMTCLLLTMRLVSQQNIDSRLPSLHLLTQIAKHALLLQYITVFSYV